MELGRAMSDKIMLLAEASLSDDGDPAHALCLAHNDYRLDNMLFGVEPGAAPLTIVDWQTVSLGSGPTDLAYMLGSGLLPETRVEHDERLVRRYVDGLAGHGVDVSFDSIWHRYVLGAFSGYLMAVTASQIVEQTERGDAMFVAMASATPNKCARSASTTTSASDPPLEVSLPPPTATLAVSHR
ncbi:MAG: phosphotransferase [Acidimicrobiales bacterium]